MDKIQTDPRWDRFFDGQDVTLVLGDNQTLDAMKVAYIDGLREIQNGHPANDIEKLNEISDTSSLVSHLKKRRAYWKKRQSTLSIYPSLTETVSKTIVPIIQLCDAVIDMDISVE